MEGHWSDAQRKSIDYFQENLKMFLDDPLKKGKFLVLNDEKIKGIYDTFENALGFAVSSLPKNEFVIQQVIDSREIVGFLKSAV